MKSPHERFLNDLKAYDEEVYNKLIVIMALRLAEIRHPPERITSIANAFLWDTSPEGREYWSKQNSKFQSWRLQKSYLITKGGMDHDTP